MLNFSLKETICHSCGSTIERGRWFCRTCGRSRSSNQHFQFKPWELIIGITSILIVISLCSSSTVLLIFLRQPSTAVSPTVSFRPSRTPEATEARSSTQNSKPSDTTTQPVNPISTPRANPSPTVKSSNSSRTATISCANKLYFVRLRKSPGYISKDDLADTVTEIPCGETVTIIGGPTKKDGLNWYQVSWNGKKGWVADYTSTGKLILIFNK